MREERRQLQGNQVISDSVDFGGSVAGNITIVDGGKMYLRGSVIGDLTVSKGGRVHIFGNVTGDLIVEKGAKVIHEGVVGRDAINLGGRLFIEARGRVMGKVRSKDGETLIDPKAQVQVKD